MTKIPTFLKNEDILSTFIGAILLAAVIFFPDFFKAQPEIYQTHLFSLIATLPIFAVGVKLMGEKVIPFAISFVAIFAISILSQYISTIPYIKKLGFESVFIAVTIGLLIRNTIGLPKWLAPAIKSEYFIKAGLVILGSSIIFGEIMKAGALGMLQAIVVVFCVWNFSFTSA